MEVYIVHVICVEENPLNNFDQKLSTVTTCWPLYTHWKVSLCHTEKVQKSELALISERIT